MGDSDGSNKKVKNKTKWERHTDQEKEEVLYDEVENQPREGRQKGILTDASLEISKPEIKRALDVIDKALADNKCIQLESVCAMKVLVADWEERNGEIEMVRCQA